MVTSTADATRDEVAVAKLVNQYTNAINRRDWQTLGGLFCENGVWDVGGPEADPLTFLFTGREQVVTGIRGLVTELEMLVQTNHAVVVNVNGDRAVASCTLQEFSRTKSGEGAMILGMYMDDIVRERDGAWRFAKRTFRFVYTESRTVSGKVFKHTPAS